MIGKQAECGPRGVARWRRSIPAVGVRWLGFLSSAGHRCLSNDGRRQCLFQRDSPFEDNCRPVNEPSIVPFFMSSCFAFGGTDALAVAQRL